MRRPAFGVVLSVAFATTTGKAHAADPDLDVTRENAAEQCPDAAELKNLAAATSVSSSTPPKHGYHVVFERSGGAYRAEIVDNTAHRTRRLEDKAPACTPLAQATAVVLATMWGSERDEDASQPASAPIPSAMQSPADAATAPRASPVPPALRPRGHFGVGSGIAVAVVRPLAPVFVSDASVEYGHGSFAIGVLWIPEQRIDLAPGFVSVDLIAGTARGCAFAWHKIRFGGCGGVVVGALRASGTGYTVDTQRTRPWFAAGLEIFVGGQLPLTWVRYRVSVGVTLPVHAETFSVAGVGLAYDTPALGGLSTLTLEIGSTSSP